MVRSIQIYFEGDEKLRPALGEFLDSVRKKARAKGIRWTMTACGGRDRTLMSFQRANRSHPEICNILLIDSEIELKAGVLEHLRSFPMSGKTLEVDESRCHLMVQVMEAWFLADPDTLEKYYGKGFNSAALPKERMIERIEKSRIETALKEATRHTSKSEYHKTKHGPEILRRLNVETVRKAAPHCDRLFKALADLIEPPNEAGVEENTPSEPNLP